ncbi:MAG TPA: hypothetical protein VK668_18020 [Mucilaginibacter sp.]|nr:hypothetical protein [Mucilaginibacter sp.]
MDQNQFVEAIKIAVLESSKKATESNLLKPPGRQPAENLMGLSQWFNNLKTEDKEMVLKVLEQGVEATVFGFFCVLDGVRSIENQGEKGRLKLFYEKNHESVLLNNPDDEYLHNLL